MQRMLRWESLSAMLFAIRRCHPHTSECAGRAIFLKVPIAGSELPRAYRRGIFIEDVLPRFECNSSFIQYQLRLLSCSSPLSRGFGGCSVLSGTTEPFRFARVHTDVSAEIEHASEWGNAPSERVTDRRKSWHPRRRASSRNEEVSQPLRPRRLGGIRRTSTGCPQPSSYNVRHAHAALMMWRQRPKNSATNV
jgi:hypothetical protein